MRSIGGYISPGLHREPSEEPGVVALNTGRNALECLLRLRSYRVLHVPRYTCGVLRQPLERGGVELRYYNIDSAFEPLLDADTIAGEEALLYTNYFGLKDGTIQKLAEKCPTLIVDQAQAYYATTPPGVDAFDSARKFLGVSDGARLRLRGPFTLDLEQDASHDRCQHLLLGSDQGVESGYAAFQHNEALLSQVPARLMSNLTKAILAGTDHAALIARRQENHSILHHALGVHNGLGAMPTLSKVPLVYPFLTSDPEIRDRLITEKIFVATFWTDLLGNVEPGTPESMFRDQLICLPVDQRQGTGEMERIIQLLLP